MTVLKAIERQIKPNQKIVVAVSGGIDSMVLLHGLLQLRAKYSLTLIVAHANHGLRGDESDDEERLVQQQAAQYGLAYECALLPVAEKVAEEKGNLQNVARTLRYAFFESVAEKYQTRDVFVAHHADDQAETILLRLLRGVGTKGMSGMQMKQQLGTITVNRPFLRVRKSELRAYGEQNHIPFLEDSSNQSDKYQRNAFRQTIAPLLNSVNVRWVEATNRYAEVVRAEEAWMAELTEQTFITNVRVGTGKYEVERDVFMQLPLALQRRLITLILSYVSENSEAIHFEKIEAVRLAIKQEETPQLHLQLSDPVRFVREYERIQFVSDVEQEVEQSFLYTIEQWPTEIDLPNGAKLIFHTGHAEVDSPNSIVMNPTRIQLPLQVRNRKTGDRIQLSGMTGRKSIKKLFIEECVPQSLRNQLPIVCDRDGCPLWIPGMRPSAQIMSGDNAMKSLHIQYVPYIK